MTKTATFAPYDFRVAEMVSIADLGADDVVAYHGALFRLVSREIVRGYQDRPVYVWQTEVLDGTDWSGPAHWLNDWVIQGTRGVSIHRMAQGVDYRFIAAGMPGGVAARTSLWAQQARIV